MKNYIFIAIISIVAIGLGVFAAYGVSMLITDREVLVRSRVPDQLFDYWQYREDFPPQGRGMMDPYRRFERFRDVLPENLGERISIDDALTAAKDAVSRLGEGFEIKEIMSFELNYYALVIEKDTGRGAFELLINPYSSRVTYEPGPNMMWNLKYGHMGRGIANAQDNSITMEQAREKAQAVLDEEIPGGELDVNGTSLYGYYTFDYLVDGKISGMLSVNGTSGSVWFHNWHGQFIEEMEVE